MSARPARQDLSERHVIGTFVADLSVTGQEGPLSAPERMAHQVRTELLPALEDVFSDRAVAGCDARIEMLEVDLGAWPEDPDWPRVREMFVSQLLHALAPYLRNRNGTPNPDTPIPDTHDAVRRVPPDGLTSGSDTGASATARRAEVDLDATDPLAVPAPRGSSRGRAPILMLTDRIHAQTLTGPNKWSQKPPARDVADALRATFEKWPKVFDAALAELPGTAHQDAVRRLMVSDGDGTPGPDMAILRAALADVFGIAGHTAEDARRLASTLIARLLVHPAGAPLLQMKRTGRTVGGPGSVPPQKADPQRRMPTRSQALLSSPGIVSSEVGRSKPSADQASVAGEIAAPEVPIWSSAEGVLDADAVRLSWTQNRAAVLVELEALGTEHLLDLLSLFAPAASDAFVTSLEALSTEVENPAAALLSVLSAVLDKRPVDLDAARDASAAQASSQMEVPLRPPAGSQEQAASVASPLEDRERPGESRQHPWQKVLDLLTSADLQIAESQREDGTAAPVEQAESDVAGVMFRYQGAPGSPEITGNAKTDRQTSGQRAARKTPDGIAQSVGRKSIPDASEALEAHSVAPRARQGTDHQEAARDVFKSKSAGPSRGPSSLLVEQPFADEPNETVDGLRKEHDDASDRLSPDCANSEKSHADPEESMERQAGGMDRDALQTDARRTDGEATDRAAGPLPESTGHDDPLDALDLPSGSALRQKTASDVSGIMPAPNGALDVGHTRSGITPPDDPSDRDTTPDETGSDDVLRETAPSQDTAHARSPDAPPVFAHRRSTPGADQSGSAAKDPSVASDQKAAVAKGEAGIARDRAVQPEKNPSPNETSAADSNGVRDNAPTVLARTLPSQHVTTTDVSENSSSETVTTAAAIHALAEATFGGQTDDVLSMLGLIWQATPDAFQTDARVRMAAAGTAFGEMDVEHPNTDAPAALILQMIAKTGPTGHGQTTFLRHAVELIAPQEPDRNRLLRHLIGRVGYPVASISPVLRHQVLEGLKEIFERGSPLSGEATHRPAARNTTDPASRLLTRHGGLVLFHPYYKMLFSRLQLLSPQDALAVEHLGRAVAVLMALVGEEDKARPLDPLARVLLGLPQDTPPPVPTLLNDDERQLIDGLMRSVIAQWSKLGQTSPAGLQDAFVRRGGSLRFDATGAHLRIDPGPFDVLLDGLPWALDTVIALPWMPVPCHVNWRTQDG